MCIRDRYPYPSPSFNTPKVKVQSKVTAVASNERPYLAKVFNMTTPIAKEWQGIEVLLRLKHQHLKSIIRY